MGHFSLALHGLPTKGAACSAESPGQRERALVAEHFDFVWRLLRRLGVPSADIDDAAQQVFIIGARRLLDISPGKERTFLYGIVLRTASTLRRNLRRRERVIEVGTADSESPDRTPHEELEHRQALNFLDTVLCALDDGLREVFVLCQIEELTAPEVAALLSIPVGTVSSRLRRARAVFAGHLRRSKAQRRRA